MSLSGWIHILSGTPLRSCQRASALSRSTTISPMYVPAPRSASCRRTAAFDRAASAAFGVSSRATAPPLATSVRVGEGRTTADAGIAAMTNAAEPATKRASREGRNGIGERRREGPAGRAIGAWRVGERRVRGPVVLVDCQRRGRGRGVARTRNECERAAERSPRESHAIRLIDERRDETPRDVTRVTHRARQEIHGDPSRVPPRAQSAHGPTRPVLAVANCQICTNRHAKSQNIGIKSVQSFINCCRICKNSC